MLSNQILSTIAAVRSGEVSAPLCLSENQVCEVYEYVFGRTITSIDELATAGTMDFLYYNCTDGEKGFEHYRVKVLKEFTPKLYEKPAGDILVVVFHTLEELDRSGQQASENALLHLFEDVPSHVLILVTSREPHKILPTLLSRMILLTPEQQKNEENPLKDAIESYLRGDPTKIFQMTLKSGEESQFTREDALWIVSGLQQAIECGTLASRHAQKIRKTLFLLETTNTSAKYLIDHLLISLSCE